MSISTTLTLSPITANEINAQHSQYYQTTVVNSTNNNNNGHVGSVTTQRSNIYFFPHDDDDAGAADDPQSDRLSLLNFATPPQEDSSQSVPALSLHRSSSYTGPVRPKSTILKQDSLNGRIATSLTDDDYVAYSVEPLMKSSNDTIADISPLDDEDAFLLYPPNAEDRMAGVGSGSGAARDSSNLRRVSRKARTSFCLRAHSFINRNWYLSYLVPLSILCALMFVAYLTRDYAKRLLYWIETQNPWVIFATFLLLFIIVSFPIVVGYFVLMITSGYLFGCLRGFLTVILGANLGIAIAHVTIKSFRHRIPMHKLIKNETGRAILRVISGPKAFKVVLFTRLTPIPFGIQNAIFGVSSINSRVYHSATFLGLLPAQTINVYLGSTLRSMHEVLNNHGTALTGYISFGVEVVCGVALMFWVVQKARKELSETLLSDISTDGKLIDIEV